MEITPNEMTMTHVIHQEPHPEKRNKKMVMTFTIGSSLPTIEYIDDDGEVEFEEHNLEKNEHDIDVSNLKGEP